MEENTTQTPDKNVWKYGFFILAAVLIIGALYVFMGDSSVTGNVVANNPGTGNQVPTTNIKIDTRGAPLLGSESAKVTIVEFSDFQCPFCRKAYNDALQQVISEYVKTGTVNIAFMQFPLSSIHPAAQASAEATVCVHREYGNDAFWKMHDKIFQEQNKLDSGSPTGAVTKTVSYGPTELNAWAKSLGYDISTCLSSGKYASEVQKNLVAGQAAGVQGTPAFIINGKLLSGAQPFAAFKAAIDASL